MLAAACKIARVQLLFLYGNFTVFCFPEFGKQFEGKPRLTAECGGNEAGCGKKITSFKFMQAGKTD
ncbi:hypothetical protein V8J88_21135 [Massilia sp. W12]|uniref:hypothetical protein n=1 Tax=Massilia sp. W12 TaxID=3126507 RepID=UPI0030D20E3C